MMQIFDRLDEITTQRNRIEKYQLISVILDRLRHLTFFMQARAPAAILFSRNVLFNFIEVHVFVKGKMNLTRMS